MAFTENDLSVINAAIAQGASSVKFADKEVQYMTLSEMKQVRQLILNELGLGKRKNGGRWNPSYDKGLGT